MDANKYKKLMEVCENIWACNVCEMHTILSEKLEKLKSNIRYRPDIPILFNKNREYKVVVVGINPGWTNDTDQENKWKPLYLANSFQEYVNVWEGLPTWERNPYRDKIAHDFNEINKYLTIYSDAEIDDQHKEVIEIDNQTHTRIKPVNIYDYVFWANLSFCNSQTPYERNLCGMSLPCNVFTEEIPNCIDCGYLKEIIKTINPEIVIFFTAKAIDYIYYKLLLKKLFDLNSYDNILVSNEETSFNSQNRSNKECAKIQLIPCKVIENEKMTRVLFLSHPGYRFNGELKSIAIKKVCDMLKKL